MSGSGHKVDMLSTPPIPCDFKVSDRVTYKNTYGVEFKNLRVEGFSHKVYTDMTGSPFIYLNTDAYWFPHSPNDLTKEAE